MAREKQKKVRKSKGTEPKKAVIRGTDPNWTDSPLTFDLSHKEWLKGVSFRDFTNKFDDETMFAQYLFELFHKVIPTIQQNWKDIVQGQGKGSWRHCRPVSEEKLDFVLGIIEKTHSHTFKDKIGVGSSLWQLGFTQNIRLIAIYDYRNNSLTPVFVDYHHLVHPDKNFNQPDYKRFGFCPVCEYAC
ncbi:hypothetical protein [Bacillus sp. J33]|uniref:hypothetical protein n=1 Tax=Bacillus sp. J33 TaxID=935836 RepID=UPI00047AEE84|nr:hypothetical protein [Bacillus sp. J33]